LVVILIFYLEIDPSKYPEIIGVLKTAHFSISNLQDNPAPAMGNPNSILCTKKVPNDQAHKGLEFVNSFQTITGINRIIPMAESKKAWADLIPIGISTTITFLVTINALYRLVEEPTTEQIFFIVGVPTGVTFLSQVLYRILKHD